METNSSSFIDKGVDPLDLEKEENIDLGKLWQVTKAHKKVVGSIIVGCTAIATIVAFSLPKQYASTMLVQTRSAGVKISDQSVAKPDNKGNYMELMKSRTVLDPIIDELYEGEDSAKKPDAAAFAKSNLDIKNTKGTNLITVTAKGRTPEEAQKISKEVVDNFLALQADNSQQSQNLLAQLFDERIEDAKRDYDDAAQKLADFSSKHGLYSLDGQLQQGISKYPPDETATYLQLKSEAKAKKNIYTNLVQQREEDKVQEAMESLDIQVIDEANLPDEKKPSAPKKKLIAAIGLALGCIIAFGYSLVMYKREA